MGALLQQLLSRRVLAVEDAQGIGGQALLGIRIQLLEACLEPGHQLIAIALAIIRRAETVDLQFQAADTERIEQIPGQSDHFRVTAGGTHPQPLDADLMKLALTAGLGPFVAEHRPAIPKLLSPLTEEAMLNGGSNHRRRSFRTQRAGAITTVLKAVHLLADDVGGLTDAAREQFGDLEQRRADLLESRTTKV